MDCVSRSKRKRAAQIYGRHVVAEVEQLVSVSGTDGAKVTFEDQEWPEHAECVEFMYCDEEE